MKLPSAAPLAGLLAVVVALAGCTGSAASQPASPEASPQSAASTGADPTPPPATTTVAPTSSASPTQPTDIDEPTTSAPPAPPAPDRVTPPLGVIPPSLVGAHVEGVQTGRWPSFGIGGLRLWDSSTTWNYLQPAPGTFDWSTLDAAVDTALRRGVTDITLVLGGTPEWAASLVSPGDYPAPGAASPPRRNEWWRAYVRAVAERYAGRITAYQVWNEMNLRAFWTGTPEQLARLTQLAAEEIRRVDPAARVVGSSAGMRTEAYGILYPRYLEALAARGWPVDAVAVHTYPSAGGTPTDRARLILRAQRDLAAAGAPDRVGLWDTEVNYGLAGPLPEDRHRDISGGRAAGWVVRTYLDSLRLGVARTYWYIQTAQPYDLLGIQTVDGSDGARGMATVDEWVVGADWRGCEQWGRLVQCSLLRDGSPQVVAWTTSGRRVTEVPAAATQQCTPGGECRAAEPGQQVEIGPTPLLFR